MKKTWLGALVGLFLLLGVGTSHAQATSANRLGWDQAAPTLAEANAYTYRQYPDGATTGTVLTGVVCTGTTSPFLCGVPFPAFTPGAHSIQLTAANAAGESLKSLPFNFTFVVIPSVPANLRIMSGS